MKVKNNVVEFTELRSLARGQVFTVSNIDSEYDQGLFFLVDVVKGYKKDLYRFFDLENNQACEETNGNLEVRVYPNAYITLQ